jgi:chitinase
MSTNDTSRQRKLQMLAALSAAVAATVPMSASAATCTAWNASTAYSAGAVVTDQGAVYTANWWTQGNEPVSNNGVTGTGEPWTKTGTCTGTPPSPPAPTPPAPTPPAPTPPAPTPPAPAPVSGCTVWNASTAYSAGAVVSDQGLVYTANFWSQGNEPKTNSGAVGTGEPWTQTGTCTGTPPAPPAPTPPAPNPTPPSPAPAGAVTFSPYKDITVSMNWNTNVISSAVTGTLSPVLTVTPAKLPMITWAFATGECGSENWGGLAPASVASANVQTFVSAGKKYILSTGGAAGSFTCGTDAGFETFVNRYASSSLAGIDFDIEAGQSQATIDALVARVKASQPKHPGLRWSFTIATEGGNTSQALGSMGITVMNSIKNGGLSNYLVNLMTMDYGSAIAANCTLGSNGKCDMAQSAIQAAIDLHTFYGTPYSQIELTPMIGGNDATDEIFSIANVATLSSWAKANGIAGVHFWSLDRDHDCALGSASATCNSYGTAGTWGFTNAFLSGLGY